MPKASQKAKFLKHYEQNACYNLSMLDIFGENGDDQRREEDAILEELSLVMAFSDHIRYGIPFVQNSVPKSLNFVVNVLPEMEEREFKQIARVSWSNFNVILDLIKGDNVFHGPRSCKQFPIEMQLLIVLYRLGTCGEGASVSKVANLFGVGDGGSIQIITNRIFKAIMNLKSKFLRWPDVSERRTLVLETASELPHCIGYVDCTEVKLAEKPFKNPNLYYSQQHIYSMKVQAVCDHKLRIRHMVLGYPGSASDATIFNNCDLSTKANDYFKGEEWIAGKTAYKLSNTVITPFKTNNFNDPIFLKQASRFNNVLNRFRVRIEHMFALIKERFTSLKELRIQIRNESSIKQASRWISVCAILHNILIEREEKYRFEISDLTEELEGDFEFINENQDESSAEGKVKRRALLEIINELNE